MLNVRDIWKSYNGKALLQGISLDVEDEETICLLGASGSGKSTMMRIIAGLEQAESGQVIWNGTVIDDVPVHKRGFGFMFQDYALFPDKTVADNVAFGLKMQGVPEQVRQQRVREVLDLVEMDGFQSRSVTQLSGGEQQRVALARALAPEPKLLMLDEPLAALDRALREQLVQDLRRILDKAHISAIYVTHDQEEAYQVADRILLIHNGVIEQAGPPDQVYQNPRTPWVAEFLGMKNRIHGTVTQADPLIIQTGFGSLRIADDSEVRLKSGDDVLIYVPENAVSVTSVPSGMNLLHGIVKDSVFQGVIYHIELDLGQQTVLRFISDKPLVVGSQVSVTCDPARLMVFPTRQTT